jgi:hypothetical protein
MLNQNDLGGHHTIGVQGKALPFPGCVQDRHGNMLFVQGIQLLRAKPNEGFCSFVINWTASWPRPMAWASATTVFDPEVMSLDDAAGTLVSVFRSSARGILEKYRREIHGVGAPKWLRRARKHQRRR